MPKELLELLEKINAKKNEVKNLAQQGKLDEAEAAKKELVDMQRKFDIMKDLYDNERPAVNSVHNQQQANAGQQQTSKDDNIQDADFEEVK